MLRPPPQDASAKKGAHRITAALGDGTKESGLDSGFFGRGSVLARAKLEPRSGSGRGWVAMMEVLHASMVEGAWAGYGVRLW